MSTFKIKMEGKKYGKVTVLSEIEKRNKHGHILYECLCDCGNNFITLGASLRSGLTKSCGCLNKSIITKHGMEGTPTYKTWISIKTRCLNNKCKNFINYGNRGIGISNEWMDFNNFYKDMGDKPIGFSIDRIDNSKGYSKENCRWASPKQKAQNRRSTIKVFHNGSNMFIDEFACAIGLTVSGARKRVIRDYTLEDGVYKVRIKNE